MLDTLGYAEARVSCVRIGGISPLLCAHVQVSHCHTVLCQDRRDIFSVGLGLVHVPRHGPMDHRIGRNGTGTKRRTSLVLEPRIGTNSLGYRHVSFITLIYFLIYNPFS